VLLPKFPLRTKYKPKSWHLIKLHGKPEVSEQVNFYEIFDELRTDLTIPAELEKALTPYSVFDKMIDSNTYSVTQSYNVGVLKKGRLYTDNLFSVAVIDSTDRIFLDISYLFTRQVNQPYQNTFFFRRNYFVKPKRVEGTVFNILAGGGGAINIGHWFLDVLPRFYLLEQSGIRADIDWYLVPSIQYDFQVDSLKVLGVDTNKILTAKTDTHIICDELISTTSPRSHKSELIPQWIVDYLREKFLPLAEDKASPKRLYVNRRDSRTRVVENETELESLLAENGFESVALSEYDLAGKITLFQNAEIIISASGAGLVNALWCKPGTIVMELFPVGYVGFTFYNVAKSTGCQYEFLICEGDKVSSNLTNAMLENLRVDLKSFQKELDRMLSQINILL